jgi:hypothetical protein
MVTCHPRAQHAPTDKANVTLLKRESPHTARTRTIIARIDREKFKVVVERVEESLVNGPAICHVKKSVLVEIVIATIESAASVRRFDGRMRDNGV